MDIKQQMIRLLWEALGNRKEPEIQILLKGLYKMNEMEVKGIARLVLDKMMIVEMVKQGLSGKEF